MLATHRQCALCIAILIASSAALGTAQDVGQFAPATYEQPLGPTDAPPQHVLAGEAATEGDTMLPAAPLPLRRPDAADPAAPQPRDTNYSTIKMFASLGGVLALFLAVAWFFKRGTPGSSQNLPKDAFEVYGRAALNPRQQVQLVRLGERLLLVAVSATGAQTLTEITDPFEVQQLSAACRRNPSGRTSAKHDKDDAYTDNELPRHLAALHANDDVDFTESRHA